MTNNKGLMGRGGAAVWSLAGLIVASTGAGAVSCKTNNLSSQTNDSITEMVTSAGATLTLPDTSTLVIPANALTEPTAITFTVATSGYPVSPNAPLGNVYEVLPPTQAFAMPVTVRLPGSGAMETAEPAGTWTSLSTMPAGSLSAANASEGGYFALVGSGHGGNSSDGGISADAGGMQMGQAGNGKIVRSNVSTGSGGGGFAVDDINIYYAAQTTSGLGVTTNTLEAAALNSSAAAVTVATLQEPGTAIAAAAGTVYWIDGMQGTNQNLMSAQPGGAPTTISAVSGSSLVASGTDLLFVDSTENLRRYELASATLDATAYGAVSASGATGLLAASTGTNLFWLVNGSSSIAVWSAAVGSPGAATSASFPSGAMLSSFGAFGTSVAVTGSSGNMLSIVTLDTSTSGAQEDTIAMVTAQPSGGLASNVAYEGGYVFITTFGSGNATSPVIRISLADGTQTTIGTYVADGLSRPIAVTSTSVYVLQAAASGNGSDLAEWPLPM